MGDHDEPRSAASAPEQAPEREYGGEAPCFAPDICAECGLLIEDRLAGICPRCGTRRELERRV